MDKNGPGMEIPGLYAGKNMAGQFTMEDAAWRNTNEKKVRIMINPGQGFISGSVNACVMNGKAESHIS